MGAVALTGKDVAIMNGRPLRDVADGDWCKLEFDDDIAALKVSKDSNAIYAFNATGRKVHVTLRVLLGSADDKYINSQLAQWLQDSSAFTLLTGSFTKRVGDGAGNVVNAIYQMVGGVFKKIPGAKSNAEGDTEQSVRVWEFEFLNTGTPVQ